MPEAIADNLIAYLSILSLSLPAVQSDEEAVGAILQILEIPECGGGTTYSLYFCNQQEQPFYAVGLE